MEMNTHQKAVLAACKAGAESGRSNNPHKTGHAYCTAILEHDPSAKLWSESERNRIALVFESSQGYTRCMARIAEIDEVLIPLRVIAADHSPLAAIRKWLSTIC